jgi:hypothetical protein
MSKPQTDLGLAFPILRLAELAAYPQINWRKIAITLIFPYHELYFVPSPLIASEPL